MFGDTESKVLADAVKLTPPDFRDQKNLNDALKVVNSFRTQIEGFHARLEEARPHGMAEVRHATTISTLRFEAQALSLSVLTQTTLRNVQVLGKTNDEAFDGDRELKLNEKLQKQLMKLLDRMERVFKP